MKKMPAVTPVESDVVQDYFRRLIFFDPTAHVRIGAVHRITVGSGVCAARYREFGKAFEISVRSKNDRY